MEDSSRNSKPFPIEAAGVIVTIICMASFAFVYTAGWLTPQRLTPARLVTALQPPGGPALGHRRNHAKGICFLGVFEANGAGTTLSKTRFFAQGQYPVVGRFNIGGGDPNTPDPMAQVRGLSMRITGPGGQEWRSAMIDAPVFAASTPEAFFELLTAGASKDSEAIQRYTAVHPEILAFGAWVKNHKRTESWTEDQFNSLDSFVFINDAGERTTVRWSFIPTADAVFLSPEDLAKRDPDFLQTDISERVHTRTQNWNLVVTVAKPDDPTADPTKAWPGDRRTLNVGRLSVLEIESEADGPCRDINFDPSVLPSGMTTSDDPFPAARAAAYRVSYGRRMEESAQYPRTQGGSSR